MLLVCLPQTCHASVYLYVCERNKQRNEGEDAVLDENRRLQKDGNETEGGQRREARFNMSDEK